MALAAQDPDELSGYDFLHSAWPLEPTEFSSVHSHISLMFYMGCLNLQNFNGCSVLPKPHCHHLLPWLLIFLVF